MALNLLASADPCENALEFTFLEGNLPGARLRSRFAIMDRSEIADTFRLVAIDADKAVQAPAPSSLRLRPAS